MKRKLLLAACAFMGISAAWADTSLLKSEDGWEKLTALPQNLGDYYYAIVDNDQDLMLTMYRGRSQGGQYNGLMYANSANPLVDKSRLFMLEAYEDDGVVMTNYEYNGFFLQTESGNPWFYRTHDNGGNDKSWGHAKYTFEETYCTIQNGTYPESGYLGPWDDANFSNGAELAFNKTGDNIGKFQIYAIEKTKAEDFYASLLSGDKVKNASEDSPLDMTALIVNPNARFWTGSAPYGWEVTGTQNINDGVGYDNIPGIFEYSDWGAGSWTGSIKQTIVVPNGKYLLKAAIMAETGVTVYLTANNDKSENLDATGTNNGTILADGTEVETGGERGWKYLTVETTVVDGKITIGSEASASAEHLWVNADNFTLTYLGAMLADESDIKALEDAIEEAEGIDFGFEEGQYAPYNNIEGVKAIAAAKAALGNELKTKEAIVAATETLASVQWEANEEEVNAFGDPTFSKSENNGAPLGWTSDGAPLGNDVNSRAFVLATSSETNYDNLGAFNQGDGVRSAGYFRFDGSGGSTKTTVYTYGATEGYTMPLKEKAYRVYAQVGGWAQNSRPVTLQIVNDNNDIIGEQTVTTPDTRTSQGGPVVDFNFLVQIPTAGNYKLLLRNGDTSLDQNIMISNFSLMSVPDVTVEISIAGYATFSSEYPLDLSQIEGGTAYIVADDAEGEYIKLTEQTEAVPANTGLIISGEGTVTIPVAATGNAPEINHLVGVNKDTEVESGYVLGWKEGDQESVGFYVVDETPATVKAGQAYLSFPEAEEEEVSGAKVLRFVFGDGNATVVEAVEAAEAEADGAVYNVAGQQVGKDYKGIVIKNGKKYLNK